MTPKQQRYARIAQAKHRKSRSTKTELENAHLLLAWEAEQLSEGQLASMLDLDRVSLRKLRADAIDAGMQIGQALLDARPSRD